jgi:hypothetical protein
MSIKQLGSSSVGGLPELPQTSETKAPQSPIGQAAPNFDAKEATKSASGVDQKSIGNVQKSKLSLQSICNGIKNLVSKLFEKIKTLFETAKNLTPEEINQVKEAMAKGSALAGTVGGAIGSVLPGVGNFLCCATGGVIGGTIMGLIELNRIAKQHAEQLDTISNQAQQAQEKEKGGQLPQDLATAAAPA